MSPFRRRTLAAAAVAGIVLVAFLFLPVVPYSVSFADPANVNQHIFIPCAIAVLNSTSRGSQPDLQHCYDISALPPSFIGGYGSPSYSVIGWPLGPYPPLMLATQGNATYLLHFDGSRLSYIEWEGVGLNTELNPNGVIRVDNISLAQWAFGRLNFTARVTNIGAQALHGVRVTFGYPTYGENSSLSPVRVYSGQPVASASLILPGTSFIASALVNESSSLLTDQSYPLTLEVSGTLAAEANAPAFLYAHSFPVAYPGVGLNSHWVQAFIQAIDQRRSGVPLKENRTLDEFATFRYNTLRAQFQISDYNFTNDYNHYFSASKPILFEEILYPAGRDPATYPDYLQQTAIGHYTALVSSAYSQYGYFFGTGPAVEVGPGCSATEVPGPDINITEYAISHGCSYVIADEIWFIIILGG